MARKNTRVSNRVARAIKRLLKEELKHSPMYEVSLDCGMSHSWVWHVIRNKVNPIMNPNFSSGEKVLKYFGLNSDLQPKLWGGKPTKRALKSLEVATPRVFAQVSRVKVARRRAA